MGSGFVVRLSKMMRIAWISGLAALVLTAATQSALSQTGASPTQASAQALSGLERYYAEVETSLLSRGFLRQDAEPADATFDAATLVRDFVQIAMRHEYGGNSPLMRWEQPVAISLAFGPSVSQQQRSRDTQSVQGYVRHLAKVTDHPIRFAQTAGNFQILVVNERELRGLGTYLRSSMPGLSDRTIRRITRMPKNHFCMVVAVPFAERSAGYRNALAIVRAEHSERMRTSCFHEEIAQGLGLPNDCDARPSIFNDDEEFAVLTRHDEYLLKMLYSDRLSSGMPVSTVQPVVEHLAARLVPG